MGTYSLYDIGLIFTVERDKKENCSIIPIINGFYKILNSSNLPELY